MRRATAAGVGVALTVKYSPPAGRAGDLDGYVAFVRQIARRYGADPGVVALCIGNEANVYGNPEASDGPFVGSHAAVARGVIAARDELRSIGSTARVGFNFAITNQTADGAFVRELVSLGGSGFGGAVDVVGVQVYPGIWSPGRGTYADMATALDSARASVDSEPALRGRAIEVLEVGAPILDETEQAARLDAFARATLDRRTSHNIVHFNWFDLWDADTSSVDAFAHYGLLRSDLAPKPAFDLYRRLIAGNP